MINETLNRKGSEDYHLHIRIRLREILEERSISQRQLALKVNMRPGTISHLCKDRVDRVYIDTLEQICEALNIHIHELIVQADSRSDNSTDHKSHITN